MYATEMQNYRYAQQLIEPILKQLPEFLPARQLARQLAIAQQNRKKLRLFFTFFFYIARAQTHLKSNPMTTLNLIESALQIDPYSPKANQLLAKAALAMNMPATAAFALETILLNAPRNTKVMHQLALLYLSQNRPEDAANIYNQLLVMNSKDLAAIKGSKDSAAHIAIQKTKW